MIGMTQDPAQPFNLSDITRPVYSAMDFPLAPAILLAWVVPLAAVAVFALISATAYEVEDRDRARTRVTQSAWLTGVLLAGPAILSMLIGPTGPANDRDAVPNVFGYVTATVTDPEGEFSDWARRRYGVDLTDEQASTLVQRKSVYAGRTDNVSNVVLLDGHEVHSLFESNGRVRLMVGTTEMGVTR